MWQIWALFSMLSVTITRILTKVLLSFYNSSLITLIQFSIASILSLLLNGLQLNLINVISIITGISTAYTTFFLNESYKYVNNVGLPYMVYRIEVILTTVFSYLILGSHHIQLSWIKIIYMIILLISLKYVIGNNSDRENKKTTENNIFGIPKWVFYSGLSGLFCVVMMISAKFVMMKYMKDKNGMGSKGILTHISVQLLVATITMMVTQLYISKNIPPKEYFNPHINSIMKKEQRIITNVNIRSKILLLLIGIGYFGFIFGLNRSLVSTPNPGYSKAIISLSTLLVTIISTYVFKDANLTQTQWIGIIISMLCVLGITV